MDRRIIRTTDLIRRYVLKALKTKSPTEISVSDICKGCNLSRSTFYLHYHSVGDVLEEITNRQINEIKKIAVAYLGRSEETVLHIGAHIRKNSEELTIILDSAPGYFANKMVELVEPVLLSQKGFDADAKATRYFTIFIIYGCMGMFRRWLSSGRDITAVELIRKFIEYFQIFKNQNLLDKPADNN